MADYSIELIERETAAEATMAFLFARPSGFEFRAGQCADLTLIHPTETDAEGDARTFSIASPPFEDGLWSSSESCAGPPCPRSSP